MQERSALPWGITRGPQRREGKRPILMNHSEHMLALRAMHVCTVIVSTHPSAALPCPWTDTTFENLPQGWDRVWRCTHEIMTLLALHVSRR